MAPPDIAIHTGRASRSQSISSDRPSLNGPSSFLSPPATVQPDPAFIAASAASQIVTNDHDSLADTWFDQHGIEPSGETALVAPPALKLVNRFLDQLLFNFLSISRSTSLGSLRPAVSEVLKPKLAKDAISGADQELHEYLGGGEDEELLAFHNGLEPSSDWDLELVWKRTRLRCMVYSSLGDMEEEDEDYYTDQEQLDGPPGSNNHFSNNPGVVSPAVAIFLTSILEYMGEQVLIIAGQAAYHRLRAKHEREEREGTSTPSEIADRVVVEESDIERVALDRTLGRLWRGWKKRIRSPTTSISMTRSFSRESMASQPQNSRATSMTPEENIAEDIRRPSLAAVLAEYEHAADIPLPMTADDVREIEIPGLARQSDNEEEVSSAEEEILPKPRPKSMMIFNHSALEPWEDHSPTANILSPKSRKRANSLPAPTPTPYSSPASKLTAENAVEGEVAGPAVKDLNLNASEVVPAAEIAAEGKTGSDHHHGLVAGVISVAATVGPAIVAGVVGTTNGEAPQSTIGRAEEETDAEEHFSEEAQIMTSSRVSLGGGRVSPDDSKAVSRQSSVRSPSVHSLRLIDVTSAKSASRSRNGSVDAADVSTGRPSAASRPDGLHSPALSESQHSPRIASPVSRGPTSSPIVRNGSSLSTRHPRNGAGDSISEIEEKGVVGSESDPRTAMQRVDVDASPTTSQFASDTPGRDAIPQNSAFVLSAPPPARNLRESQTSHPGDNTIQANATLSTSRALPVENGVPPLTPLREMMEGAAGTSDEASSVAPSNDALSMSERRVHGHSSSDSTSTIPIPQRALDQQRSNRVQPVNTSRSSPPRASRDEASRKIVVESVSKGQRSIHTSGSGSSSTSHKLKPVRTSEESAPRVDEDKGRSFEQLIRSDQTIQYTLTPQNMRNIESHESPRYVSPAIIPNSNDVQRPITSRSHSSSVGKLTGLHSHPATEIPKSAQSAKALKPTPRIPSNTGTRLRANAPQPRDARVDRDSIGDFAEFIRSTGPIDSYEPIPPRSAPGHRGANGVARNGSGSSPRSVTVAPVPRRANSSAGRSRLQARDATVSRGDSISDLIDFVRSGPQLDKENHRIPRTVAPFRTTMDSDQMSGAIGGKAVDASLPDPRYSQASTSVPSSVNSQSALLTNTSKNKPLPMQDRDDFEEADMMPKRKTRRVRDPYAIDSSDDEEENKAAPKPKAIQEESLADFLRNVPPPLESTTAQVFDTVLKPSSKNARKKSSTSNLMSRFGRNGSGPQVTPKPNVNSEESRIPQPRQLYTPIAAKYSTTMNLSTSTPPTSSTYVSQLDTARNKVVQKSFQPREAVYSANRTNDLADFLLRSEPPSSMQTQPQTFTPSLQKEEASAFQRMFGRKKFA